jgi:hypothetical protein
MQHVILEILRRRSGRGTPGALLRMTTFVDARAPRGASPARPALAKRHSGQIQNLENDSAFFKPCRPLKIRNTRGRRILISGPDPASLLPSPPTGACPKTSKVDGSVNKRCLTECRLLKDFSTANGPPKKRLDRVPICAAPKMRTALLRSKMQESDKKALKGLSSAAPQSKTKIRGCRATKWRYNDRVSMFRCSL